MTDIKETILHIQPLESLIKTEIVYQTGTTRIKYLTAEVLVQCLRQSLRLKPRSTGLLPSGCLALTVKEDSWNVVLLHEQSTCDVTYHETVYRDFPIPRVAVRFQVNIRGNVSGFQLAILGNQPPEPHTPLFTCPFPNISGFHLCVGSNSFTGYDSLWKLRTLPHRLLSLPFADDYYKQNNTRLNLSAREFFEHMKDKDATYYYSHVLKPSGKTLSDFLR